MKGYLKVLAATTLISSSLLGAEDASLLSTEKGLIYKVDSFQELKTVPTFSLGAPGGLASGYGGAFLAIAGTTDSNATDGGLALGMGYGNPDKLGGAVSLAIGSINPQDGGAGNRGSLGFSVGHNFNEYLLGVSLGVNNIDLWHDNGNDEEDPSFYLAATKLFPNDYANTIVSVGIGNNNYAKVSENEDDKEDKIYPFFSVAAYIMPQVSLILDYTSDITSVGVGLVPFPKYPVSLSFGLYDVTKEREEDTMSFMGTLAIGFKL